MRLFTRVLAWSGLTGLMAAIAAASPALADPAGTIDCGVSGQVLTNPPVQLTGGTGTYSFNSTGGSAPGLQLNCLAANTAADWGLFRINLTSNGAYTNTVCGTGSADSTDNVIANPVLVVGTPGIIPWVLAQQDDLDYHVQFAATAGTLTFDTAANAAHAMADPGNATGGGPIQITDPTPANTAPYEANHGPNDCTTDFQVEGSFAAWVPAE